MSDLKMKIGIFGDSYAHPKPFHINSTPSWVDFLRKKYEIHNFAQGGSSLYYSMTKFQTHQHKYEKIIFVITQPGRLLLPFFNCFNYVGERCISNKALADHFIDSNRLKLTQIDLNPSEKIRIEQKILIWRAAQDYFTYLSDIPYNIYIQQLMIKDIINTRPDAILIPGNFNSFSEDNTVTSMFNIYEKECQSWGIDPIRLYVDDIRHCHITAENNKIFADKVEEWLNGAPVKINLDDFVEPSMESKKFYLGDLV